MKRLFRSRRFRRFLFLAVACAMIYGLLGVIERNLVFQPATAKDYWQEPPSKDFRDFYAVTPSGERVHSWWLPREGAKDQVVLFHGNASNLSGRGPLMMKMAEALNVSVLIFDYPGFGKSDGRPNEASCNASAESVVGWATDQGMLKKGHVIYLGESLGGGVATELATRIPPKALVLLKTYTSLPAAGKFHYPWLPTYTLMRSRFDNLAKLPTLDVPVFVVGATRDSVLPFDHSQQLFDAAKGPKEFFRLNGHDHNTQLPEEFFGGLKAFLDRLSEKGP